MAPRVGGGSVGPLPPESINHHKAHTRTCAPGERTQGFPQANTLIPAPVPTCPLASSAVFWVSGCVGGGGPMSRGRRPQQGYFCGQAPTHTLPRHARGRPPRHKHAFDVSIEARWCVGRAGRPAVGKWAAEADLGLRLAESEQAPSLQMLAIEPPPCSRRGGQASKRWDPLALGCRCMRPNRSADHH